MINPLWLRTFCTLVDTAHFTRTAEQLHMTQPGVSQHIQRLEAFLGTELLIRNGKQFSLSEPGHRLYQEAQTILQSLSNLEQTVRNDPPHEGLVRIMSPGSLGLRLYPKLLALQRAHRQLIIDYRFAPNVDVETAIASSRADLGFMTTTSSLAEVSCTPVASEPLVLVTPAEISQPCWETLLGLGFIDHPDGSHHAQLLLGANFPQFQHVKQFVLKGFSNQIGLILQPVCLGLGFTVLPRYAVDAFHAPQQLAVHELPHPISETLHCCVAQHRALPARVNTVMQEALQWLSPLV